MLDLVERYVQSSEEVEAFSKVVSFDHHGRAFQRHTLAQLSYQDPEYEISCYRTSLVRSNFLSYRIR